jgi:5-methylcytosine-specific restriction protein A
MHITDDRGAPLNSNIDVAEGEIVLHSRSGAGPTARNRDYKAAFITMVRRLRLVGLRPDIFLDSAPVQHRSLTERQVWRSDEFLDPDDMFAEVVRRMNAFPGSVSRGAWRRLLFKLPEVPDYATASVITGTNPPAAPLPTRDLRRVKPEHLARAVDRVRKGSFLGSFSPASDYRIVLNDGTHLAPKAVFGWALAEALRIFPIPDHFSGGEDAPATRIMRDAGYRIELFTARAQPAGRPRATPEQVEAALAEVPHTDEDRTWIEGDLKRANHLRRERAPGLAANKRADFIQRHGKLYCERCGCDPVEHYESPHAIACIEVHHSAVTVAEMQPGHKTELHDLQCLCANCHRLVHREMKEAAIV